MGSETREYSHHDGQPILLFVFNRGPLVWRYTNSDRDEIHGGETFTKASIKHSEITDGGTGDKIKITVTMQKNLPVVANWTPYPPQDVVAITIMTKHDGEDDFLVDWIGRVVQPSWSETELTLTSEPSATTAKRGGKGRKAQRACDHVLFDDKCGVDPAGHELPATILTVVGFDLTATAFLALPTGRLAGGYVEWERLDGLIERRSIDEHVGNRITVDYGSEYFAEGLELSAYPGCNHTDEDCGGYFDNQLNNGGFKWLPQRNNFDGNPVR